MPNDDYILRSDALKAILGLSIYDTIEELEGARTIAENTWADGLYDAYKIIEEEVDAADVEPKRKTGFWTDSEVWIDYENNARETVRCSLCNNAVDVHCANNYCTYCGARMLPEPPKETDGDEQTTEDI